MKFIPQFRMPLKQFVEQMEVHEMLIHVVGGEQPGFLNRSQQISESVSMSALGCRPWRCLSGTGYWPTSISQTVSWRIHCRR